MKRFLKKLFFFALPIFLFFSLAEYLLRNIPNDYSLKFNKYKELGKDFETLILGNSYALYDLDPSYFSTRTFNGGHLAQPLDIDAAIFHKFEPTFTKLKYLVIPISDMSFFFKLENSSQDWRMTNYSIYYKLHSSYKSSDYFEILNLPFSINRNRLISYYIKNESSITVTNLGFGANYKSTFKRNLDTSAKAAGKVHKITDFKDFPDEKNSLEQIILTCYQKNIKVILFIPPAYSLYASNIDSVQLRTTLNTCRFFKEKYKNVSYFNLLNDTSFNEVDYFDAVHLNEIGAKKLSFKINTFINQL